MKIMIAAVLSVVMLPLAAWAQQTSFDYDRSTNFAGYRTFAFKDGTKVGDPLIDKRIADALASQLGQKGLQRAEAPDVFVVYHIAFDKEKDISAWSTGGGPYGYYWGGGWGSTDIRVREIIVGTLVVDVVDARTNAIVWRGIGVREVDTQATPEKRDRNINKAVEKILKNYPPKATTR